MNIAYIDPLMRAWERMKKALFKPFDLRKWLVVGFTAFLAGLLDGHGGGGNQSRGGGSVDFGDLAFAPQTFRNWLIDNPAWFIGIIFIAVFVVLLIIVLSWLSSRGKFMFLDNVVHDRMEVAKPWHEFRDRGNSLFLWRLAFGFICLLAVIAFVVNFFEVAADLYEEEPSAHIPVFFIVRMALTLFLIFIIAGFINLCLNDFVVPIMYKQNLTATQAWTRFLDLFRDHVVYFLLYALFMMVLIFFVIIIVIGLGFFTCCVGFLLLAIPYIGSVVFLPVSYTFRAFSLEFLGQFGPDYALLPPLTLDT